MISVSLSPPSPTTTPKYCVFGVEVWVSAKVAHTHTYSQVQVWHRCGVPLMIPSARTHGVGFLSCWNSWQKGGSGENCCCCCYCRSCCYCCCCCHCCCGSETMITQNTSRLPTCKRASSCALALSAALSSILTASSLRANDERSACSQRFSASWEDLRLKKNSGKVVNQELSRSKNGV